MKQILCLILFLVPLISSANQNCLDGGVELRSRAAISILMAITRDGKLPSDETAAKDISLADPTVTITK